ncbi:MAG TPA: D-alanyl-D-alanine carboxypeptidase/D-alanyl-D-alanine-endopeptidase [Longimicrobiales bacterium]
MATRRLSKRTVAHRRTRVRPAAWPMLPLLAACASAPAGRPVARPAAPTLAEVVDSTVTTPPLDRTHWGIEVHDPARGRPVYRLNADQHFVPASNMKLVVTTVAMGELGPDYRYRTELLAAGVADSVARELIVVGSGDPTMSGRFFERDAAPVEALADSVYRAGIRRVEGALVIDASRFDAQGVHPTWELGDLPWYYAAPTAAFAIAEAAAPMVVSPGAAAGAPAVITFPEPAEAFVLHNRLVTDTAGAETDYDVERAPGSYDLHVSGTIAADAAPDTLWLAVVDPAAHAARALVAALERRGIEVAGGFRVIRDTAAAAALPRPDTTAAPRPDTAAHAGESAGRDSRAATADPDAAAPGPGSAGRPPVSAAHRIAVWTSPPMHEIVAGILEPSQNWIAEQVLKTLGAERDGRGSWPAGLDVERRYLVDVVGIDSAAVHLVDGSGLSAQNLLTPHATVRLLAHARSQPWGATYREALAEPGEEGTLERRLETLQGRVHAKTGSITHVNTLSGFLRTGTGRELIFSVMTNASGVSGGEVREAIDRIVAAMADAGGRE